MIFVPVIERELRVRARRPVTYWTRCALAGFAIIVAVEIGGSGSLVGPPVVGRTAFLTVTWATLLLPVVHPWYWLGPLALGAAAGVRLPALLGLAAPASYVTYAQTPFRERAWARVVSYLPLSAARKDLKALASEWTNTKAKADA